MNIDLEAIQWAVINLSSFKYLGGDYESMPKRLEAMLAAAPTPPAQEAEPVYQLLRKAGWDWDTVSFEEYERSKDMKMAGRRILYTRPDSSELRKAAEEVLQMLKDEETANRGWVSDLQLSISHTLRAALGKKS